MMAKGSNSSENIIQNFTRHRRDRTNRTGVPAHIYPSGEAYSGRMKKNRKRFSVSEFGGRKARWSKAAGSYYH